MNNLLKHSRLFLKKNASTILTVMGGAGVIATSVMAVKATPKAMRLLEEAQSEKGEELTTLEKVQVAGPSYIPAITVGAATITCIFGANMLNKRQQAALASAYALLDSSYKDYKNKVKELHGEEFDEEIRASIAKDKYEEGEYDDEDDDKLLYYDEFSGRYFRATPETVFKAEYELNKLMVDDWAVCLNDLYKLLDIPTVDYGDYVGWSGAQLYEMYWSSWINFHQEKVVMDDGLECTILRMTEPVVDYNEY